MCQGPTCCMRSTSTIPNHKNKSIVHVIQYHSKVIAYTCTLETLHVTSWIFLYMQFTKVKDNLQENSLKYHQSF